MRPTFADTAVTEAGIRLEAERSREERDNQPDRVATDAAYREWRRSRVVFMHPEADPLRQQEPGTVPEQRDGRTREP